VVTISHSRQSLQDEVDGEYVERFEVFFIETVVIDPRELIILGQVVIQSTKVAPEACQQMSGEKYEKEQSDQIYIVPHLHYIVAACEKEFVHDRREKFEKAVSVDESSKLEGVERKILGFVSHEAWEDREEVKDEVTAKIVPGSLRERPIVSIDLEEGEESIYDEENIVDQLKALY